MVLPAEAVITALDSIRAGDIADTVESHRLDFKRQGRSREDTMRDLAAAAVCFANSDGGTCGFRAWASDQLSAAHH